MVAGHKEIMADGNPGLAIRALRTELGLTLQEVSDRTGLAVSTLSKLEKGRVSLSYEKLVVVSKGLGVGVQRLLGMFKETESESPKKPAPTSGRRIIHRVGDGVAIDTAAYSQLYLATDLLNRQIVPILAVLHARTIEEFIAEFGDLVRHPGEEFAFVLEGSVEFHSELYAPTVLKKGESIYFDSSMGHAYLAAEEGRCVVLSVCTGPERTLRDTFEEAKAAAADGKAM